MSSQVAEAGIGYPAGVDPYVRAQVVGFLRHRVDGSCGDARSRLEALFARPDGQMYAEQAKLVAAALALAAMRLAGPVTADMTVGVVAQMSRLARTLDVNQLDQCLRGASGAPDVPLGDDRVLRLHGDASETLAALAVYVDIALIRMTPRLPASVARDGGWVSAEMEHEYDLVRGETLANLDFVLADSAQGHMATRSADLDARDSHILRGPDAHGFAEGSVPVHGAAVVTMGSPPIKDVVLFVVPAWRVTNPMLLREPPAGDLELAPQGSWWRLELAHGPALGMSVTFPAAGGETLRFLFAQEALRDDVRVALSRTPMLLIHAWQQTHAPVESDIPGMVWASVIVRQPVTLYRAIDTGQVLAPGAA